MAQASAQIQARVWTRGFLVLFAGGVIAAALADLMTIYFIRRTANPPPGFALESFAFEPVRIAELALLLSQAALAIICLAGSYFASSWLVRAGLYLQAGAAICQLASYIPVVGNILQNQFWQIALYLPAAAAFLNLLSLACLSYGLIPWRKSIDSWLIVVQLLLSGAGIAIVLSINQVHLADFVVEELDFVVEELLVIACNFLALSLLLVRFTFWWRFPLITCLLAARALLDVYFALSPNSLLLRFVFFAIPSPQYSAFIAQYSLEIGRSLGLELLFLLGIILLVQTMRAQKRAQHALVNPSAPPPTLPE